MDVELFDDVLRSLGQTRSRRGALAVFAGLAAGTLAEPGVARRGKKRRKAMQKGISAPSVSAASVSSASLVTEGDSDAERVLLLAHFDWWPLWDHTDLTVAVHAGGNADAASLAAIRQAVAIWGDVLDRHFDGMVTLTDVTDDHEQAVKADLRVHFNPNALGWKYVGIAKCNGNKCRNVFVKSDWPESACCRDVEWKEVTPTMAGQVALHELGHALGLGHADPILTTDDIMGYGFLPWFHFPAREPVLSTCDLKALDEVFAWRREGAAPRRPSAAEVIC